MALEFEIYAYNLVADQANIAPIGALVEQVDFTLVAPGGYQTLSCTMKLKEVQNVPLELRPFANVAVMDGTFAVFLGRWDEPGVSYTESGGETYTLSALGAASVLKDDPDDVSYTNHSAWYILGQEITRRSAFLPIDQDTSAILPDQPTAHFSPAWNGKTIDDEINELNPELGDYQWAVWGHPNNRDAAGFPTWQVQWHVRDTATISYTGYLADVMSEDLRPSVEYSYNVVQILYRDATTDVASSVTVSDSRLAGSGAQGTAPFPRRKLRKDFSGDHLSATEATQLANALLTQYENGGYKLTVHLASVYDSTGAPINLCRVRPDANILLPELTPTGSQLALDPTVGVNLFYIQQMHYQEQDGQPPICEIACQSFYDTTAFQLARMENFHQRTSKNVKAEHTIRAAAAYETGQCGTQWGANGLAGDVYGAACNFKTNMTNTPTSITLTLISSANTAHVAAANITNAGFMFQATVQFNGAGNASYTYQTVGN